MYAVVDIGRADTATGEPVFVYRDIEEETAAEDGMPCVLVSLELIRRLA